MLTRVIIGHYLYRLLPNSRNVTKAHLLVRVWRLLRYWSWEHVLHPIVWKCSLIYDSLLLVVVDRARNLTVQAREAKLFEILLL